MKSLLPRHPHTDIAVEQSNSCLKRPVFVNSKTYKWVGGNFDCSSFRPPEDLSDYRCPLCCSTHPMNFIFAIAVSPNYQGYP